MDDKPVPLPEDALKQQAFLILSRLRSCTEDVVRLDAALAAVAAERERCAKIAEAATKEQRDSIAHLCPGGVCECRIAAAIRDPAAAGGCPPTTAAAVCGA